ncbi:DUF6702 family protein [Croceitalea sp. P059]|uniref:DUF6702 family protein n=1 Tax=Croceitalea sp. P059 TaxID=3075601 RepID=UPI00288728B2|nr:DUF6702 family protein [Croceitalea sp. P059]MDT0541087.1 hypothetical protein [Croceitalea sp. P059]
MKKTVLILILVIMPLLSFAPHKFYVSVTNINYSEKDDALQITTRIFIDDFEAVLSERYGVDGELATSQEAKNAEQYMIKYLKTKFVMYLNGEQAQFNYIGKKYDNDVVICYLEIANIGFDDLKTIEVENEVLTDMYDEQKNLVHIKYQGKKKSFVLIKENNKGMLNL